MGIRQHASARSWTAALASLLILAACGSPPPSEVPSDAPPSDVIGASASPESTATPKPEAWIRAPNIEQPPGFMTVHTDASGRPYMGGCSPCHPAIDTVMTDVVAGPTGLVAVGWIIQGFKGATWTSTDGLSWRFTGGYPEQTLFAAVATNGKRYVAVGRNGQGAIAWSSTDGSDWRQTSSRAAFADVPLRLTSVTSWGDGFVAAGFKGDDFFSADGAFWTSPDGLTWTRAPDSPDLRGARVESIAASDAGLVAVGQAGPADHPGPAVVWTSADGVHWRRVPDSSVFLGARMRAVANVPGIGLVAVGEDLAGGTGIVWISQGGTDWVRAPDDPVFGRAGIQLRMYDVAAGPHGAVIVGTVTEGTQYGEAGVWTSSDGMTWIRLPSGPAFLDTEMNGATRWGSAIVAAGDRGAPDAYQATAWLSPPEVGK
jgi:hypothetical protein